MKKFIIQSCPVKPVREVIKEYCEFPSIETIQDLIDYCNTIPVLYKDIIVNQNRYYMNDLGLCWEIPESDKEFNKRLNEYEKDLKKYNEWYKENEKQLKEIEKQKLAIHTAKVQQKQAKDEIQKQIKELQEKLKGLDK